MIVLGSGSAARRAMLAAAGVEFEVAAPDVDEDAVKARGGSARDIARSLARAKALTPTSSLPFMGRVDSRSERGGGVWSSKAIGGIVDSPTPDCASRRLDSPHRGEGGPLVIGADQTLEFDGLTLSKAASLTELRTNLIRLRGQTHTLYSAVAVARDGEVVWDHIDAATLSMRSFSDSFLEAYLARCGDKVRSSLGGYWFEGEGVQLFERVEGDYSTILGMPLLPLLGFLRGVGAMAS